MHVSRIVRARHHNKGKTKITSAPIYMELLRTCRTIYNEASPVLYKHAIFDISVTQMLTMDGNSPKLCWLDDLVLSPHLRNVYLHNSEFLFDDLQIEYGFEETIAKLVDKLNKRPSITWLHINMEIGRLHECAQHFEGFKDLDCPGAVITISTSCPTTRLRPDGVMPANGAAMLDRIMTRLGAKVQTWLRLPVYEFAFLDQIVTLQVARSVRIFDPLERISTVGHAGLLTTCRAIYAEAKPILYKKTIFDITLLAEDYPSYSSRKLCWLDDLRIGATQSVYLRVPDRI
ncbi:hypothetical protein B0A48_02399 [Cryoendolithus antarcticus]|uniref:DUF7730 domain-containing protein n=1 Tax=Cryoendolithus antarcticus TaxID=1507870 RepID=A0A1V8TNI7_9PEZI|nr:hypothetical protein B0A48_02399 [Cryoendolithus antarcticus]